MKVELVRIYNCPTYCIGKLYINGEWQCDVVEDTDRGLDDSMSVAEIRKIKVYSKTAIPTGKYRVTMDVQSPKFSQYDFYKKVCKGYLPRLIGVPGYEGVLIHCGSSAASSAGCLIVGLNKIKGKVVDSQTTFKKLMKQHFMPAKVLGEDMEITITRKYKV